MSPDTKESSLARTLGTGTGAVARFLVTRPVLGLSRLGGGARNTPEEALRDELDLASGGFGKTATDLRRVAIFRFCFEWRQLTAKSWTIWLNRYWHNFRSLTFSYHTLFSRKKCFKVTNWAKCSYDFYSILFKIQFLFGKGCKNYLKDGRFCTERLRDFWKFEFWNFRFWREIPPLQNWQLKFLKIDYFKWN